MRKYLTKVFLSRQQLLHLIHCANGCSDLVSSTQRGPQSLTVNTIYTDCKQLEYAVDEKTRYSPARQERKLSNYIERYDDHLSLCRMLEHWDFFVASIDSCDSTAAITSIQ